MLPQDPRTLLRNVIFYTPSLQETVKQSIYTLDLKHYFHKMYLSKQTLQYIERCGDTVTRTSRVYFNV